MSSNPPLAEISAAPPLSVHAELTYEDLRFSPPGPALAFGSTDDISADGDWFGQERALAALELGLRVAERSYNLYVCGLAGTNREERLAQLLRRFTVGEQIPADRILVQNYGDRDRPHALSLPAGWAVGLRREMAELIQELHHLLPTTFREETFEDEKERLAEQFGAQSELIKKHFNEHLEQAHFALHPDPTGDFALIPLKDGRPLEPQELESLSAGERDQIRRQQRELARELKAVMRQQRALLGRLSREVKLAERRVAGEAITPLFDEIAKRYPNERLQQHLQNTREHILDHLVEFQERPAMPPNFPFPGAMEPEATVDYEINVLVDNSGSTGAPLIVESAPSYKNLFGAVERVVDRFGKLVTNFTRVTAGSLLRADGGCIVLNIVDVLSEPLVWRALKRCLKTGQIEIEAYDPFALFAISALKSEPIPLNTRVVLTGPAEVFELLYVFDDEFDDLFKVRVDFGFEADGATARNDFIAQLAHLARSEKLPPFTAAATARILEFAARTVGDRRKLPSQMNEVYDLMREAAFWVRRVQADRVDERDVETAIEQRRFRLGRPEEKLRELIRDGTLLLDLDGRRVGQINGLAVIEVAGHGFGRPSRITAAVSMGTQGVIALDREVKLSGKTYDKGVLTIVGYLRQVYAQDFPLTLSASLSFEQSYSALEGDSASAAELLVLLSSLSGVPLRQDIAVTGSVNQFGQIQPIGGINEKVEGFFFACREVGITGEQGVMLPAQNVTQLILHHDVIEAVRAGQFHLYPVRTIDEAIAVLCDLPAGSVADDASIHGKVAHRLRSLAEGLRSFAEGGRPVAA